jgi:hypothetical protein
LAVFGVLLDPPHANTSGLRLLVRRLVDLGFLDHDLPSRSKRIRTDGADQGIQVGRLLHPRQIGLGPLQTGGGIESVGLVGIVAQIHELLEIQHHPPSELDVALLLDLQALAVPVGGEQGLAGEEAADRRVVDLSALIVPSAMMWSKALSGGQASSMLPSSK